MSLANQRAAADAAAERLKIYAQPQRLMILSCLLTGEHNVGEIEAATGIGQPALSQQLAELRRADMVRTRRVSRLVVYRLADTKIETCVRTIEAMFGDSDLPVVRAEAAQPPVPAGAAPAGAAIFARVERA